MTHTEIRQKFLDFFKSKGHAIVPSSSLLPTDPSVLFTTAGMQQFKPYFTGQADPIKDFGSRRTTSIQKAMRTSDIDEVGDDSHLTFFEMLGHFSFGDYFKKETVEWTYKLLTQVLNIDSSRISATVFAGDSNIPFDEESYAAWSKFLPPERIRKGPRADNVWGPAGPEGPCGAANEVYVDDLEVATLVFMEYNCARDGSLSQLPQRGVDVGWGFERIVKIIQNKKSIFETDLFTDIIRLMPEQLDERQKRIISDHSRAIAFLITDGVQPSNKEQGYVLRRLIRRIITYFFINKSDITLTHDIFAKITEIYGSIYSDLNKNQIIQTFDKENEKFGKSFQRGLKELESIQIIDASLAFKLYESYGLPFEVIKEVGEEKAKDLTREQFEKEYKKHQEISRAGVEKKFGGHGIVEGDLTAANAEEMKMKTRLHTATHLIAAALKKVLGQDLPQAGSDITVERLRFDFKFPRKITPEELKQAEDIANDIVDENLPVTWQEMDLQAALDSGASAFFKLKYPPKVKVYAIGDDLSVSSGRGWFSREICGGPHVKSTGEIGHIRITKEESVSGGNRRIRAVVD